MVILDARDVPGINHVFAIASKETTIEQMLRFDKGHWYRKPDAVDQTSPVSAVTWPKAIEYCLWLDEKEGFSRSESCYPPGGNRLALPLQGPDLTRTGYRLPTRAEWEFASLAGATTRRYYGEADALLDRYGWVFPKIEGSRLHPVGLLLPNDFGLFDLYGNVSEWNADVYTHGDYKSKEQVFISGGSYHSGVEVCDSVHRSGTRFNLIYDMYGFRIAQTIELDEDGNPK
jgi:formylglycine-generating enzyme required for sulfatase activity